MPSRERCSNSERSLHPGNRHAGEGARGGLTLDRRVRKNTGINQNQNPGRWLPGLSPPPATAIDAPHRSLEAGERIQGISPHHKPRLTSLPGPGAVSGRSHNPGPDQIGAAPGWCYRPAPCCGRGAVGYRDIFILARIIESRQLYLVSRTCLTRPNTPRSLRSGRGFSGGMRANSRHQVNSFLF